MGKEVELSCGVEQVVGHLAIAAQGCTVCRQRLRSDLNRMVMLAIRADELIKVHPSVSSTLTRDEEAEVGVGKGFSGMHWGWRGKRR
jgi:hypothetical protein